MDDIMIIMHKAVVDAISTFDTTQFGIFGDSEQEDLKYLWDSLQGNILKFIALLPEEQKLRMALWITERTTYATEDLAKAMKKFSKYLESSSYKNYKVYPKHKQISQSNKILNG